MIFWNIHRLCGATSFCERRQKMERGNERTDRVASNPLPPSAEGGKETPSVNFVDTSLASEGGLARPIPSLLSQKEVAPQSRWILQKVLTVRWWRVAPTYCA